MRSLLPSLLIAASAFLPAGASAECLSSAAAVRAVHGESAWSTYRHEHGKKCYSLGERPGSRSAHRAPAVRKEAAAAPAKPWLKGAPEVQDFAEAKPVRFLAEPPPVLTPSVVRAWGAKRASVTAPAPALTAAPTPHPLWHLVAGLPWVGFILLFPKLFVRRR